jgi:hypothetical protein
MRYTELQVNAILGELRKKFIAGEVDGSEIVIALVAMEQSGKIDTTDIRSVLLGVYYGNLSGVLRALHTASTLMDRKMIDGIIKEVRMDVGGAT